MFPAIRLIKSPGKIHQKKIFRPCVRFRGMVAGFLADCKFDVMMSGYCSGF